MADAVVISGLATIQSALTNYFVPLAGASGLTVALMEAVKKLLSLRGRFHRSAVLRWLAEDQDVGKTVPGSMMGDPIAWLHGTSHYDAPGADADRARRAAMPRTKDKNQAAEAMAAHVMRGQMAMRTRYEEFFQLTTGLQWAPGSHSSSELRFRGIDTAVFELEIARMMSQIQDAADTVLNNPARYPALYGFLTRGVDGQEAQEWSLYVTHHKDSVEAQAASMDPKVQADRFGRIRLAVRRQLDAFQGVTQSRWDDLNQMWAMVLGAVILLVAQLIAATGTAGDALSSPVTAAVSGFMRCWHNDEIVGVLIRSILGGVLAPIAKDLVSSISSIKFSK